MTLDDRGEVSDARVLSGPEELRKATLEAVLQWHYSPTAISSTVTQATLRFHLPATVLGTPEVAKKAYAVQEGVEGELSAWSVAAPKDGTARLEIEKPWVIEKAKEPLEVELRGELLHFGVEFENDKDGLIITILAR